MIGRSTHDGSEPATEPIRIPHLVSSVLHTLFDVGQLRVTRGVPDEVLRAATAAQPIAGLF